MGHRAYDAGGEALGCQDAGRTCRTGAVEQPGARVARADRGDADVPVAEAGELVWQAGPLTKGAGLCHGTAGNGYAFLALHGRTRDARWLERARARGVKTILDADAKWLSQALPVRPDLIKPNVYEAAAMLGRGLPEEVELRAELLALVAKLRAGAPESRPIGPESLEALEALGYVE